MSTIIWSKPLIGACHETKFSELRRDQSFILWIFQFRVKTRKQKGFSSCLEYCLKSWKVDCGGVGWGTWCLMNLMKSELSPNDYKLPAIISPCQTSSDFIINTSRTNEKLDLRILTENSLQSSLIYRFNQKLSSGL